MVPVVINSIYVSIENKCITMVVINSTYVSIEKKTNEKKQTRREIRELLCCGGHRLVVFGGLEDGLGGVGGVGRVGVRKGEWTASHLTLSRFTRWSQFSGR